MRVLTLVDAFRMGGAETLLAPLATAARREGIELEVVSLMDESVASTKTLEVLDQAGVRPRMLRVKRLLDPTAIPQIVAEIRRSRCDVVHSHLEMANTLAVPAARLARTPVVCTFHHVAVPTIQGQARRERLAVNVATRADRTIFVSTAQLDSWHAMYRRGPVPDNWTVVHNGVDLDLYAPDVPQPDIRTELTGGRATDGPVVVLPAAFRDFKGIPVAIEAWPLVQERCPDAVLSLVGGGEMEEEIRDRIARLGLEKSVVLAGVRSDMPAVYRSADLVLLPSIHGENLPTVLIEAAASGRAVAASRVGGIPDIVDHRETGLLFERDDPAALAAAVIELLEDADLRERLGTAGVAQARTKFSADAWVRNLRRVYEAALASPSRPKIRS
ncbi:glycosyltransferase family 4 protein [Pseudonocardia oroxyli]|uniref:Glycosyltransferase involved in cell wall bisynthesis n=1 Tax=Pseudonocardia oroxyli TaxID=366584 RepID=A0A1G7ZCS4_PSEOR|nr:glycosyltransferase family 4 protein [Pseudonocardia oroxyli]SDH06387.1 Glycosyltransferase involved in cell wall bisynthesis [Pseudonocardia oroxyli]